MNASIVFNLFSLLRHIHGLRSRVELLQIGTNLVRRQHAKGAVFAHNANRTAVSSKLVVILKANESNKNKTNSCSRSLNPHLSLSNSLAKRTNNVLDQIALRSIGKSLISIETFVSDSFLLSSFFWFELNFFSK